MPKQEEELRVQRTSVADLAVRASALRRKSFEPGLSPEERAKWESAYATAVNDHLAPYYSDVDIGNDVRSLVEGMRAGDVYEHLKRNQLEAYYPEVAAGMSAAWEELGEEGRRGEMTMPAEYGRQTQAETFENGIPKLWARKWLEGQGLSSSPIEVDRMATATHDTAFEELGADVAPLSSLRIAGRVADKAAKYLQGILPDLGDLDLPSSLSKVDHLGPGHESWSVRQIQTDIWTRPVSRDESGAYQIIGGEGQIYRPLTFTQEQRNDNAIALHGWTGDPLIPLEKWLSYTRDDRYKQQVDLQTFGGVTFKYVPNLTGNYDDDLRRMKEDPLAVRSVLLNLPSEEGGEAGPGGWTKAGMALGEASQFGVELLALGGGLGRLTAGATQATKGTGFLRGYLGAAARGSVASGARGGLFDASSALVGGARTATDLIAYEEARRFMSGQGSLAQSTETGLEMALMARALGMGARGIRLGVLQPALGKTKGMLQAYFPAPGNPQLLLSKELKASLEAAGASSRRAEVAAQMFDSMVVGQGFYAHGYAQEKALENGVAFDVSDPQVFGWIMDGMRDPMGLAYGVGIADLVGLRAAYSRPVREAQARSVRLAVERQEALEQNAVRVANDLLNRHLRVENEAHVREAIELVQQFERNAIRDAETGEAMDLLTEARVQALGAKYDLGDVEPISMGVDRLAEEVRRGGRHRRQVENDISETLSPDAVRSLLAEIETNPDVTRAELLAPLRSILEAEVDALDMAAAERVSSGKAKSKRDAEQQIAAERDVAAEKADLDTLEPELAEKARMGVTLKDVTPEELESAGLYTEGKKGSSGGAKEHAKNSVNKRLGKDYEKAGDVPLIDVVRANSQRKAEQVARRRATERAAIAKEAEAAELRESERRDLRDRVYEQLHWMDEFKGKNAELVLAEWMEGRNWSDPEAAVAAARSASEARRPKPEPRDVEAADLLSGRSPSGAEPDVPLDREQFDRGAEVWRGRSRLVDDIDQVVALNDPRMTEAFVRGMIYSSGGSPAVVRLASAMTGMDAQAVRNKMASEGVASVSEALPQLRSMRVGGKRVLTDSQLKDSRTVDLLRLAASAPDYVFRGQARTNIGGARILRAWEAAARREGPDGEHYRAQLEQVRSAVKTKASVFDLRRAIADRVAHTLTGKRSAGMREVGEGWTGADVADDILRVLSGQEPEHIERKSTTRGALIGDEAMAALAEDVRRPQRDPQEVIDSTRDALDFAFGRLIDAFDVLDTAGLVNPKEMMDAPGNREVMRRLIDGDQQLEALMEKSGAFDNPGAAFAEAREMARNGQDAMAQLVVRLEESAPDGKPEFVQDVLAAIRLRNSGEQMPDGLRDRLSEAGFLDESTGHIKDSAAPFLSTRAQIAAMAIAKQHGVDPIKIGGEDIQVFSSPLNLLFDTKFKVSPERSAAMSRIVGWALNRPLRGLVSDDVRRYPWFTEGHRLVDYLQDSYRSGDLDQSWSAKGLRAVARTLNATLGRAEVYLARRGRGGSTLSRGKQLEYRELDVMGDAVMTDITLKAEVLARDLTSELTGPEAIVATVAMHKGVFRALGKNASEARAAKTLQGIFASLPDADSASRVWWAMRRYAEFEGEVGNLMYHAGMINRKQLDAHIERYVRLGPKLDSKGLAHRAAKMAEREGTFGYVTAELERMADPGQTLDGMELDMRVIASASASEKAHRLQAMKVLSGLANGVGSISRAEYESLPPSERGLWTKAVHMGRRSDSDLRDEQPLPGESSLEFNKRIRELKPGSAMIGIMVDELQRSMQSHPLEYTPGIGREQRIALMDEFGSIDAIRRAPLEDIASVAGVRPKVAKNLRRNLDPRELKKASEAQRRSSSRVAPWTEQKQSMIDGIQGVYVPKQTVKELELFAIQHDPSYGSDDLSRWLADRISMWRANKTALSQRHILMNWFTSMSSGDVMQALPMQDVLSSLSTGKGHFADSMRASLEWHDWSLGIGPYEGWGSKNRELLQGHEHREAIEKFDRTAIRAGGATLRGTVLTDGTLRDRVDSVLMGSGVRPSNALGEHIIPLVDAVDRLSQPMHDMHLRNAKFMLSPIPEQQAESVRQLLSWYGLTEMVFKHAGVLHLMEANPGARFDRVAAQAFEATADYGIRNPHVFQLTSMINPFSSSRVQEAARKRVDVARTGVGLSRRRLRGTRASDVVLSLLQRPFLTYNHTIGPSYVWRAVQHPVRSALVSSLSILFSRLMGTAATLAYGVNQWTIDESTAGDSGFSDEPVNVPLSPEAMEHAMKTYDFSVLRNFGGVDFTNTYRAMLDQSREAYGEAMRDGVRGSRQMSTQFMGMKGSAPFIVSNSEPYRPLAFGVDTWSWLKSATSDAPPQFTSSDNTFLAGVNGFLGTSILAMAGEASDAFLGEEGKSTAETAFGIGSAIQRHFAAPLRGSTSFFSTEAREFYEAAKGREFRDIMAGSMSPAFQAQPFDERLINWGVKSAIGGHTTSAASRERSYRGELSSRLKQEVASLFSKGNAKSNDKIEADLREVNRSLRLQVEQLAQDAYYAAAYGDRMGVGLDVTLAEYLNGAADYDANGTLLPQPATHLGRWAKRMVERGHEPEVVRALVLEENRKLINSTQADAVIAAGRSFRMDPVLFRRVWKAAAQGDTWTPLMKEMEIDLLKRKDFSNLGAWRQVWDYIASTASDSTSERVLSGRLREFWGNVKDIDPNTSSSTPFSSALKGRAPDVAPLQFLQERQGAPALQAILPRN